MTVERRLAIATQGFRGTRVRLRVASQGFRPFEIILSCLHTILIQDISPVFTITDASPTFTIEDDSPVFTIGDCT